MQKSLPRDPRVVRISSALKADRLRTVGGLFSAWCLFDEQTEDGKLEGYTPEILDELIGLPGLAAAMCSVGWLDIEDNSLRVPRFDEHNGKSAKRRSQENDRKMSARDADKCPQEEKTPVRKMSSLEKRRIEKNNKEPQVAISLPFDSPEFETAWTLWLTHKKEIGQKMPPTTIKAQLGKLKKWGEPKAILAIENAIAAKWQGLFEPKPELPAHRPLFDTPTYRKNGTSTHRPLWD